MRRLRHQDAAAIWPHDLGEYDYHPKGFSRKEMVVTLNAGMEKRLAALDAALRKGISEADSGRVKPAEDVFKRLVAKYKAMAEKTK